jgi:hypothetical protein
MRYNHYFKSGFGGCRLLYDGHDPHRNREVRVYALPGEFSVVGVTDGVDTWIASSATAPSEMFDRVRKALTALQEGTPVPSPTATVPRRALNLPPQDVVPPRRRLVLPPEEKKVVRRAISS